MPIPPGDYLQFKLVVIPYQEGDPAHRITLQGSTFTTKTGETSRVVSNPGYSIRQLQNHFGGNSGYVTDPHGGKHFLDLSPWLDSDPDKTRLRLKYVSPRFKDPGAAIRIKGSQS